MGHIKQIILDALARASVGDDMGRAKRAFARYSEHQMDLPYGDNDRTPRQMLREYAIRQAELETARAWVERQPD